MNISGLWEKYSKQVFIGIGALALIVVLVLVGQWYAAGKANALADRIRQEFQLENRLLYDNLAVLKDRTQQLEQQYSFQKGELDRIRRNQKGGATDAFNNPNKKVAASYFDNTIDSYIPGN